MLDLLFVLLPGRERLIATTQPDETSLIYRTVPTCAYIVSIFDLPVPGRDIFWIERMKAVPAYRQPCFLSTPPTPDGDIYLAAPEPATAASTPPTSCADFASLAGYRFPPASCAGPGLYLPDCLLLFSIFPILLAGLYTNKSNSFYSKSHMYRVRRKSPNSWFVIEYCMFPCPPVTPNEPNETT